MGKNIIMRKKDGASWHDLYPRTTAEQVWLDGGLNMEQAYAKGGIIVTTTGDNNYIAASPLVTAYTDDLTIDVLFTTTNTGAPTINVNSIGVVAIGELDETGAFVGLKALRLKAYQYAKLRYRSGNFLLISSPAGAGGGSGGDGIYVGTNAPEDTTLTWLYDLGTGTLENSLVFANASMSDPNASLFAEEITPEV